MGFQSKKNYLYLTAICAVFSFTQAEAQIWNKIKDTVKKEAKKTVEENKPKEEKPKAVSRHLGTSVQSSKCPQIIQWAGQTRALDRKINISNFWGGKYGGKYLMSGFKDEMFKPVFGKSFGQWTDQEIKEFESIVFLCRRHAVYATKKTKINLQGEELTRYRDGIRYIGDTLTRYSQFIDNKVATNPRFLTDISAYPALMAYQREIYFEHRKALALQSSQQEKAKSMSATKANIDLLTTMTKDPQFAYLRPEEMTDHKSFITHHITALTDSMIEIIIAQFKEVPETFEGLEELQGIYSKAIGSAAVKPQNRRANNRRSLGMMQRKAARDPQNNHWKKLQRPFEARSTTIMNKIIENSIEHLNDFSDDLNGIRKLSSYRTEIRRKLGPRRVSAWPRFESAYLAAINNIAKSSVPEFQEELRNIPATAAGLKQVQNAVPNLFQYSPKNIKAYRLIAKEREVFIIRDIRKTACYASLDNIDLDKDDRDVAILAYSGETTLGMFICAMNRQGYKFQEFDAAGIFGSISTFSVQSPRGITLSIEMKKVEAVKDREMLVGILVKDATSETKFTLSSWQDYAGQVAGMQKF